MMKYRTEQIYKGSCQLLVLSSRAGKKPRFFVFFLRFLGFLGFKGFFIGFLGFNVHNAEHRYIIYDPRQVTYMKISVC